MRSSRFLRQVSLVLALSFLPVTGYADIPAGIIETLGKTHAGLPRPGRYLVRVASPKKATALGLRPLTSTIAVATRAEVSASSELSRAAARWSVPRRPLLDRAGKTTRAGAARNESGLDGTGSLLGLIDTGVDISHPAFRNEAGGSRIEWLLTFDEKPKGLHPDLEDKYGCSEDRSCAVYSRVDLDLLLADDLPNSGPSDDVGHGTHVLSTMAGRDDVYPGVAPKAGLLVVQAGGTSGSLDDADILTGAQFLFDRAKALGKPVAINLSLGSSFGHHDGSSALEEGLAELLDEPGRAIVVAAGNEGGLYEGLSTTDPAPYGSHLELTIPRGSDVEIPLHLPDGENATLSGGVYVWLSTQPGDELSLAFDASYGVVSPEVAPGEALTVKGSELGDSDPYEVSLINGGDDAALGLGKQSLLVLITGELAAKKRVVLRLRGHGSVQAWAEGAGEMAVGALSTGPLFPAARSGGTVAIPAAHPRLLAVGSSINRESWTDYSGTEVTTDPGPEGELSWFSGAGPNLKGDAKPDLLAPGENLIAAMSALADPRLATANASQFASGGSCPDPDVECYVVDDLHAISSGTSMSAPLVTGAIALLFQRQPTLTQDEVRTFLRGGAARSTSEYPAPFLGAGVLDVVGALRAQERALAEADAYPPAAETSRLAFSTTFFPPDPERSFEVMALLRDEDGNPTSTPAENSLHFSVKNGAGTLEARGPGYLRFRVHANENSGGKTLDFQLDVDGEKFLSESLPIGVDPYGARYGYELTGGTCAVQRGPEGKGALLTFLGLALAAFLRRGTGARFSPLRRNPSLTDG